MNCPFPKTNLTIARQNVRMYSNEFFAIPCPVVKRYFESYYLLYWKGSYFIEHTKNKYGMLIHNGIEYQIVYKYPLTRSQILAKLEDQYAISFRKPKINYGLDLPAIALVAS
jgi:hypothetical protein